MKAGMKTKARALLIGVLVLAVLPSWVAAEDVVRLLTFGWLRPGAVTEYDLALLHEALDHTRRDYRDYQVEPFAETVSIARGVQLASEGRLVNLLLAGAGLATAEREMIPVPFPIDRGILGYRVALIDRRSQDRLSRVHSIDELRQLRVGQGIGWSDVRIYEHERVPVETPSDYDSLVSMLLHGRFDLFPRGLYEIAPEMAANGRRYPDLAVEKHILLHYPFCETLYVSRSAPRLAARLTAGLERMVADRSFDALFARYFGKQLADLNLRPTGRD